MVYSFSDKSSIHKAKLMLNYLKIRSKYNNMFKILPFILVIWNIIVFLLYGVDKIKAMTDAWRIKERTLIIPAFLLGGIGAVVGMLVFWHKIRKPLFFILIPIAFAFNVLIFSIINATLEEHNIDYLSTFIAFVNYNKDILFDIFIVISTIVILWRIFKGLSKK